jgi:hypothetical protein
VGNEVNKNCHMAPFFSGLGGEGKIFGKNIFYCLFLLRLQ